MTEKGVLHSLPLLSYSGEIEPGHIRSYQQWHGTECHHDQRPPPRCRLGRCCTCRSMAIKILFPGAPAMSRKGKLKKICCYLASFQKRNGYLPEYLMESISGLALSNQVQITKVLEKKYPQVLQAIRAWESETDDGPDGDENAPHHPEPRKIEACSEVQSRAMSERMFQ